MQVTDMCVERKGQIPEGGAHIRPDPWVPRKRWRWQGAARGEAACALPGLGRTNADFELRSTKWPLIDRGFALEAAQLSGPKFEQVSGQ